MSEGSLDQDPQNYGLPLATNQLALTLHVASITASVGRRRRRFTTSFYLRPGDEFRRPI